MAAFRSAQWIGVEGDRLTVIFRAVSQGLHTGLFVYAVALAATALNDSLESDGV